MSAKATDNGGHTRISAPIVVRVEVDSDHDGLSDLEELILGTNPNEYDSDDDDVGDALDPLPVDKANGGDTTRPTIQLQEPPDAQPL